jgi:hypothetical protein
MKVIHKHELRKLLTPLHISCPAKIIHVADQGFTYPTVWYETDVDGPLGLVSILVVGTGHNVPPEAAHVGSAICGKYVRHVYVVEGLGADTEDVPQNS